MRLLRQRLLRLINAQLIIYITSFPQPMSLLNNQSRIKKEAEIYQDLSRFIQIIKRTVTLAEHTAINIQKGNDYLPFIDKIKILSDQMQAIVLKYKSENASLSIEQITFHRFICRIAEVIALPKAKYQDANQSHSINCFTTCIREVQRVVKKYSEEKLFCRIVELTQIIFIKFCINCEASIKTVGNAQAVSLQGSDSMKKMTEKMSNFRQIQKNSRERSCLELTYATNSQKELQKSKEKKHKLVTISQTLSQIQKRYDNFKGMDVDYSFFKTSYFEAKNNYDSFYKEWLQRNTQNAKIITLYLDDHQFLRKKNQKIYQRNRRLKTNQEPKKERERSQECLAITHNDRDARLKKSKANQTCDEALIREKIGNHQEGTVSKNDLLPNKIEYQMKNVYLTLTKKNMSRQHHRNRLSPSTIKKRILQTQSNNQSFINQKTEKSCTIHLEKKQQGQAELKQKLIHQQFDEMLTSYQKNSKSNNQIISAKVSTNIPRSTKPLFKSKYLQINCITNKKESNSKSQLILNRAPHKYIVKIEERERWVGPRPI